MMKELKLAKEQMYGTDQELDKKVDSPSESVRVAIARKGYGLDRLVNDLSPRVRFEVALHGYGLDRLESDPDEEVRRVVSIVRRPKIKIHYCGLELTMDRMYGFDPEKDKLVDSPKVSDRVNAAKMCYGLDVLVCDPSPLVRYYVARNHYGLDILKNDPSSRIRNYVEQIIK